jgi:hypothetical protein
VPFNFPWSVPSQYFETHGINSIPACTWFGGWSTLWREDDIVHATEPPFLSIWDRVRPLSSAHST